MAEDIIFTPLDEALTLFGCYVSDISFSVGWNTNPSTLSVTLIEAPEDGKNFAYPNTGEIGTLIVNDTFRFIGLVDSWKYVKNISGRIINMELIDFRAVAQTVTVVLYPNDGLRSVGTIIDVYDYYSTGDDGNESEWQLDNGMPWEKIVRAIQDTTVTFGVGTNANAYRISLGGLPSMPEGYRVNVQSIGLLDLIDKVGQDGGFDYYVDYSNAAFVISFIGVDRTGAYNGINLENWLNARRGDNNTQGNCVESEEIGIENRNMREPVGAVLVGAPKEEMIAFSQEGNVYEYWGYDSPTTPQVNLSHIRHANYNFANGDAGEYRYLVTQRELLATFEGFDTWVMAMLTRRVGNDNYQPSPLFQRLGFDSIIRAGSVEEQWFNYERGAFAKLYNLVRMKNAWFNMNEDESFAALLHAIYNEYRKVADLMGTSFYCIVPEFQALYDTSIQLTHRPKQLLSEAYNGHYEDLDRIQKFLYNPESRKMSGYVIFDDIDDDYAMPKFIGGGTDSWIYCYPDETTDAQEDIDRPGSNAGRLFVKASFELIENSLIADGRILLIKLGSRAALDDPDPFWLLDEIISDSPGADEGEDAKEKLKKELFSAEKEMLESIREHPSVGYVLTTRENSVWGSQVVPGMATGNKQPPISPNRRSGLTGIVIPAASLRETYGPWAAGAVYVSDGTISKRVGWHGKIATQQDADFAPWNFESESDMEEAAEARVSRMITQLEEVDYATFTITGLPELAPGTPVGSNANVSDMNISANTGGVLTTYYVHAYSPRFAELSKDNRDTNSRHNTESRITRTKQIYFQRSRYMDSKMKFLSENARTSKAREEFRRRAPFSVILGQALGPFITGTSAFHPVSNAIGFVACSTSSMTDAMIKGFNNNNTKRNCAASSYEDLFIGYQKKKNTSGEFYRDSGDYLPSVREPTSTGDDPSVSDYDENRDGRSISMTDAGEMTTDSSNYNEDSIYGMALRAPVWIAGWGFNTEGEKVPTQDNITSDEGGTWDESEPSDETLQQWRESYIPAFRVGPLDIKWNEERGVWEAGGGIGIHRHIKEDTTTLGGGVAFACYFPSEGYDFLGEGD